MTKTEEEKRAAKKIAQQKYREKQKSKDVLQTFIREKDVEISVSRALVKKKDDEIAELKAINKKYESLVGEISELRSIVKKYESLPKEIEALKLAMKKYESLPPAPVEKPKPAVPRPVAKEISSDSDEEIPVKSKSKRATRPQPEEISSDEALSEDSNDAGEGVLDEKDFDKCDREELWEILQSTKNPELLEKVEKVYIKKTKEAEASFKKKGPRKNKKQEVSAEDPMPW